MQLDYLFRYESGERVARTKTENLSALFKSELCIRCQFRYFPEFNHPFACRVASKQQPYGAGGREAAQWDYAQHTPFI